MDSRSHDHDCSHRFTRRTALRIGGGVAVPALAGCLGGGGGDAPDPVSLTGSLSCDVCGMVIGNHPGPNGQLFYRDEHPEGHDNPARFDTLKHCFFPYKLEHEQRGWGIAAAYVTDYSSVDYTVSGDDEQYISSHPEAAAFGPAEAMSYVVGSSVRGAMGDDFVSFSASADAESFASEYGGDVVAYDDIDQGLVGR
ncbi:nitrous oxide reductase accessory protein NosL [Haloplanus sp. GCM10025708]|uniref:nitrous oxide reductase accessory protein NosL n=1 Tax=Haloferacaceae TaxID=1644056 RepID=UPI00360856CA